MVGDRGMITGTRIEAPAEAADGAGWITALRAPAIAALAADDGPLQMSLFDSAELRRDHPPRLPGRAADLLPQPGPGRRPGPQARGAPGRHREADLAKIRASVGRGAAERTPDKIGVRVGKVIGKHKVGKHFIREITDTSLTFRRDQEKIAAEAALDGILRASAPA